MIANDFDKETKYKLFRSVTELLHPSISKKNISDYRIVVSEDCFPLVAFYPKKVTNMNRVIIYLHGDGEVTDCQGKYTSICKKIASNTNSLVLGIDYELKKHNYLEGYEKIKNTIEYILKELSSIDVEKVLMADSTGAHILIGIHKLSPKKIDVSKEILFYPVLSLDYYGNSKYESITKQESFNETLMLDLQNYFKKLCYKKELKDEILNPLSYKDYSSFPKTLILTGRVDSLLDESKEYIEKLKKGSYVKEVSFASHGFLKRLDHDIEKEVFEEVNKFLS